ncbi:MAG: TolC family protein [Planctomycetaceae bacterium]|jgi:outer membrane protein TolC|nr:TolC family protein [bacterium]MDC0307758.1 TolC family protein [Planctomycetaceae bacterium]MDG2388048.1 TolC family protein [Planctomycetaceae bacterium]
MRLHQSAIIPLCLILSVSGCQSSRNWLSQNGPHEPERAIAYDASEFAETDNREIPNSGLSAKLATPNRIRGDRTDFSVANHESRSVGSAKMATLMIDGQAYKVQLVPEETVGNIQPVSAKTGNSPTLLPLPAAEDHAVESTPVKLVDISFAEPEQRELDLVSTLSMVGGQHPVIGFAQWRVQEAYAQLDQAEVLWLPSLQAGFSYHRHDGNYQSSNGQIVDVNRNSFQLGMGEGATGAGTTPRPGVVAQFHMADAYFQPEIAQKNAWARGHAANATQNKQLLNVALAYIELLNAEQDHRILEQSRDRTRDLSKITSDFAASGQGLQADADRMATELSLLNSRISEVNEQADIASARLAQTLSIDAGQRIVPRDPMVVPIELITTEYEKGTLISTGLMNRPELKEAQNLVSAACDQYKRQKYAPLVPSVMLGMSAGGFGGGLGNTTDDFSGRYDFDALMMWEVRNLGLGEKAARRETQARVEQAKFQKVRLLDQVAAEVNEAHSQVTHRRNRMSITKEAIASAQNSYERNVRRIRDGQGLPIEALQSLRALEDASRAYLKAVTEYNEAQFRLQWALGWPVVAPAAL